jgi:hypothetical protein
MVAYTCCSSYTGSINRIMVHAGLGISVQDPIRKTTKVKKVRGMAQLVEHHLASARP